MNMNIQELLQRFEQPDRDGERLQHVLIGSPEGIFEATHTLHALRDADVGLWSPRTCARSRVRSNAGIDVIYERVDAASSIELAFFCSSRGCFHSQHFAINDRACTMNDGTMLLTIAPVR